MTHPDALQVAERLFAAIPKGDLDAVREIYAPDARIWHNHDGVVQDPAANLAVLGWIVSNLRDISYDEIRRAPTPGGFVQQHVMRATLPNGKRFELTACIVCTVVAGRITRLDEYLDSAALAALAG